MDVKALRERLGLSQAELALKLGSDQSLVSKWERGERSPGPDEEAALQKLAVKPRLTYGADSPEWREFHRRMGWWIPSSAEARPAESRRPIGRERG